MKNQGRAKNLFPDSSLLSPPDQKHLLHPSTWPSQHHLLSTLFPSQASIPNDDHQRFHTRSLVSGSVSAACTSSYLYLCPDTGRPCLLDSQGGSGWMSSLSSLVNFTFGLPKMPTLRFSTIKNLLVSSLWEVLRKWWTTVIVVYRLALSLYIAHQEMRSL